MNLLKQAVYVYPRFITMDLFLSGVKCLLIFFPDLIESNLYLVKKILSTFILQQASFIMYLIENHLDFHSLSIQKGFCISHKSVLLLTGVVELFISDSSEAVTLWTILKERSRAPGCDSQYCA